MLWIMVDKSGPDNSFHDWLFASAYVRGADQSARVVSKKKHRPKRSSGVSDTKNEMLEAERRIRLTLKVSNRHYRRCMNDRLLRELASPLDATEIGSHFAPPPWGERSVLSPFERVSAFREGSTLDLEAWEPFRNDVDMDVEAKALQRRVRHQGKNLGIEALRHNAAIVSWQGVSHRSRDVLRRKSSWHLVNLFEEKILDYLREMETGAPGFLVLDADDAYHRMLIHGICEFHHLSSKTISRMEDGEGTAVMIKGNAKRKKHDEQQGVSVSVMGFLTDANKRAFLASAAA